jgi:hypothetical protein
MDMDSRWTSQVSVGRRLEVAVVVVTGDGVDGHATVALQEDVHGVLEHCRPEEQRRDVVEHDACTTTKHISAQYWRLNRLREGDEERKEWMVGPGLGKWGTTRMALEMPCSRGSTATGAATASAAATASTATAAAERPFSLACCCLLLLLLAAAASIMLTVLQLASSPINSSPSLSTLALGSTTTRSKARSVSRQPQNFIVTAWWWTGPPRICSRAEQMQREQRAKRSVLELAGASVYRGAATAPGYRTTHTRSRCSPTRVELDDNRKE